MMLQNKYLKTLSLLLLISSFTLSCSILKPKPKVILKPVFIERTIPIKKRPKPLTLLSVRVETVSYKNLDQFLKDNNARNGSIVFIAMDVIEYEALSINTAKLFQYIQQQKALIIYYEELADEN